MVGLRKITIVFVALALLISLASGCGSKSVTNASASSPNQGTTSDSESLDARVENNARGDVAAGERAPDEVVVMLQDGITEGEAYSIFASHGFEKESVEKQYVPQMYALHFSEGERDIKSVIRELLLDSNVLDAYTNTTIKTSD